MKALVTGLSGFTGKYVGKVLNDAGYKVFGLGCDLLDSRAVDSRIKDVQPDVVVHLAAISFVAHNDLHEMYGVNIVGTRNLLSGIISCCKNVRSIVIASSAKIYGPQEGALNEATLAMPKNDYAVSKYAMELMTESWANDLPITIVRPFNYVGLGQAERFLVSKIVGHFKKSARVIELGNLDVSRDFSDVRDVANAYLAIVEANAPGKVVNICSGNAISLRSILQMCNEKAGFEIGVEVNQEYVRENEIAYLVGDPSMLERVYGYKNTFTFSQTLDWMLFGDDCNG